MVRAAVAEGILVKGGGHAMAAGLTVERANLGRLRTFFEERAERTVRDLVAVETLKIDGAMSASGATLALADQLEQAGPLRLRPSAADLRAAGAPHPRCAPRRRQPPAHRSRRPRWRPD
jgi:hypothetical protein